jgi:hypothetical protein
MKLTFRLLIPLALIIAAFGAACVPIESAVNDSLCSSGFSDMNQALVWARDSKASYDEAKASTENLIDEIIKKYGKDVSIDALEPVGMRKFAIGSPTFLEIPADPGDIGCTTEAKSKYATTTSQANDAGDIYTHETIRLQKINSALLDLRYNGPPTITVVDFQDKVMEALED